MLHLLYLFTYLSLDVFSHQKSLKIIKGHFHREPLTCSVNTSD